MGTDNTFDIVRMGNFDNIYINWYLVKKKVVNLLHSMRDLMKWGEGQQIMVIKVGGMSRVKETYRRWEDHRSINSVTPDCKDPSKVMILILSFPRNSLCALTMPRY